MTKDELIRMADLAGFDVDEDDVYAPAQGRYGLDPRLEHFAQLVTAFEREACARICQREIKKIKEREKNKREKLRQALAQDHSFDRTASHMAGEYVDTSWDTSDMAHRASGLSVEQEPVAWMYEIFGDRVLTTNSKKIDLVIANGKMVTPLYTAPPSKPWVSLSDEDITRATGEVYGNIFKAPQKTLSFARAIEAKLREKNT